METLIVKISPIIVCLVLGILFQAKKLLAQQTIEDLKFIVINVALPAVLFQAFSKAEISLSLIFIPFAVFLFCFLLFGIGMIFEKTLLKEMQYSAFFMTGFEFGMIGSAFLISLFGVSAIKNISLIIIGHELFIWFVYFPFIGAGKRPLSDIAKSSVKSPILISIILALVINITGLGNYILSGFTGNLIDSIAQTLANIIAPLILFIVGYSMKISLNGTKTVVPYLAIRLFLVVSGGILLFFIIYLFNPEYVKEFYIYMAIFIFLPPPYILPLFIDFEDKKEIAFFSGANVYYTIISFVLIFIVLLISQMNAINL